MEPRGFESLTSAVQRRRDTLLDLSEACKIGANKRISALSLFLVVQASHSGCCTYGALDRGTADGSSDLSEVGDIGHASARKGWHRRRQDRTPKEKVAAKWKLLPKSVTKPLGKAQRHICGR